jgi:hypothetical protein
LEDKENVQNFFTMLLFLKTPGYPPFYAFSKVKFNVLPASFRRKLGLGLIG